MTWTYAGDPGASPRDAVRYRIGDVNAADPLATDEEIAYELEESGGDVRSAAAEVALAIGARFARLMDITDGDVQLKYSQRHTQYMSLAAKLGASAPAAGSGPASSAAPLPFAGGISSSDPLPTPAFSLGMHDNDHW